MAAAMQFPVLALLLLLRAVSGDFLGSLKAASPDKLVQAATGVKDGIQERVAKEKPEQLIHSLKDQAAQASPEELLSSATKASNSLKESLNGSTVQKAGEDLRAAAGQQVAAAQPHVESARQAAGAALEQGKALAADAADAAAAGEGAAGEAAKELRKAAPEDLASKLRKATQQVSDAANSTGFDAAETLAHYGAKAAAFLNQTGNDIAGHLDKNLPFDLPPLMGPERNGLALSALLLLVLPLCAVSLCFRGLTKARRGGRGGEAQLSESLMEEVGGGRQARAPVFQIAQEPLVEEHP